MYVMIVLVRQREVMLVTLIPSAFCSWYQLLPVDYNWPIVGST